MPIYILIAAGMTILAENDQFEVLQEKLGEGTYGAVFTGRYKSDRSCQVAFKFLKETNKQSGLMSSTNCRELLFLSLVNEIYDPKTSPYIPLITVVPSKLMRFNVADMEELQNCTVIVMPNYESDFQGIIFSPAMRSFTPVEALFLFRDLLGVVRQMNADGYAHRDLKHGNILTDQKWNLKIIDFGMVQYLKQEEIYELQTDAGNEETT